MFTTKILRYKILYTERISEDRRIHVYDMASRSRLSFNYDSLKRNTAERAGEELTQFIKTKEQKINLGFYDKKEGRAS